VTINKLAYIANAAAGGDTGNGIFGGNGLNWVINPGQGFFVRASATAGNLSFKNSMRRGANNGQLFRMDNESAAEISRLWLNIESTEGAFSQTAIGYTPDGTTGLDYGYDGLLFNDEQTSIYTMTEGKKLAIQARPQFTVEDVVPVAYKAATAGSYTISVNNADGVFVEGQEVFLKDKVLNTIHNLSQSAYAFTTDAGNTENRFEIIYSNNSLGTDDNIAATDSIVVYKQDKTFFVEAGEIIINEIAVFDISGRRVYHKTGIDAVNTTVSGLPSNNQVLIIQITTADSTVVTKKVIN
jgi:roadblock/LC7 domain-containing protein